jgi:hypothetical protein
MGLWDFLTAGTKHQGQHAAGKHTKQGSKTKKQPKPPKQPKGK